MQIVVDEQVGKAYPGAAFGLVQMTGVRNPPRDDRLEELRREVERELRERLSGHSRARLKTVPPFDAYCAYYGRFNRTYHVLLQLESILKGKSIPSVTALVEAMFLAELRHQLLTAGHDLAALALPLHLAVAEGNEEYTRLAGNNSRAVRGDLLLRDGQGVISSILSGPDRRTRLRAETRDVLFFVYAPPGVGETLIRRHLEEIENNVRLFEPEARRLSLSVVAAS